MLKTISPTTSRASVTRRLVQPLAVLMVVLLGAGLATADDWQDPWMECMPEPGAPVTGWDVAVQASLPIQAVTAEEAPANPTTEVTAVTAANESDDESRPYLGVYLEQDTSRARDGVVIEECIDDSPAQKAGLLPADRIVEVAGEEVGDAADLLGVLASCKVGERVVVVFVRGGERWRTKARLGEAPEDIDLASLPSKDDAPELPAANDEGVEESASESAEEVAEDPAREASEAIVRGVAAEAVAEAAKVAEKAKQIVAEPLAEDVAEPAALQEQGAETAQAAAVAEPAAKTPGWLGVLVDEYEDGRLVVAEVVAGSPADRAGLREGDLLREVNQRKAHGLDGMADLLGAHGPGSRVTLTYERAGETHRTRVVLGKRGQTAEVMEEGEPEEQPVKAGEQVAEVEGDAEESPEALVEGDRIKNEVVELAATISPAGVTRLRDRIADQEARLAAMRDENLELQAMVQDLTKVVQDLQKQIATMQSPGDANDGVTRIEIHIVAPNADVKVVTDEKSAKTPPHISIW